MPEAYIGAVGLTKAYKTGGADLVIFSDLNFEVPRGEMLALVGESGAGKSTLLHLLGGLDHPTGGEILYGGRNITNLNEEARADFRNREIGFAWQTHYLLPEFTALENVAMPLLIRGRRREEALDEAMPRLEEVGLRARAAHRAGELSGGEQQRVALARALVARPNTLLADEPTGNLDFRTAETVFALLRELHCAHGLTSVLVTHNMAFARRADRVLALVGGRIEPA